MAKKRAKAATKKRVKRAGLKKRKAATRRRTKRVSGPAKKKSRRPAVSPTPKRRKRKSAKKVIKQVERTSVERVLAGRRRRRHRAVRRRRSVTGSARRRSVGKGSTNMLLGIGIGAVALYLLTRNSTPTYPAGYTNLPPVVQTPNPTRNTQTQDIVNYAIAGGMAIDAIIKLIGMLNGSDDSEVQDIHDNMHSTGDLGIYI